MSLCCRVRLLLLAALLPLPLTFGALTDGLITYWPLNEGSGTQAADIVSGHNGTLQAGATWVAGKLGSAIDTNNSGYIVVTEHAALRPVTAVSVQAWVSIDAFGMWDGIVGNIQDNGTNESGYCLYTNSSGVDWYVSVNGRFVTVSATASAGQWIHFVGTFDGSYVRLYRNGQLAASAAASGPINWTFMPKSLNIGRYYDDNEDYRFDGRIDEVAIWNRALTADEIIFLYNNGSGNPVQETVFVEIKETGGLTSVREGESSDTYEVSLYSEPTANVLITATPSDAQIDLGAGPGSPITLTFTKTSWNIRQTVTVTAVDDSIYEGKEPHKTTITHTAAGGNYQGVAVASVVVDVLDNELICGDWGYFQTDINRDCYVDLLDFAMFAEYWLETKSE